MTPTTTAQGLVDRQAISRQSGQPKRKRSVVGIAAASTLLVVVLALLGINLLRSEPASNSDGLLFVIPAGSAARLSQPGVESAITLPTLIRFKKGETAAISVRNEDTVVHRAGPFVVNPGETYTMRFPEPGEYPVTCTVDPSESIRVIVEA
ncbi:MAG TPA: hypothetical protein VIL01_01870 [Thermomicrobiales bacterium]